MEQFKTAVPPLALSRTVTAHGTSKDHCRRRALIPHHRRKLSVVIIVKRWNNKYLILIQLINRHTNEAKWGIHYTVIMPPSTKLIAPLYLLKTDLSFNCDPCGLFNKSHSRVSNFLFQYKNALKAGRNQFSREKSDFWTLETERNFGIHNEHKWSLTHPTQLRQWKHICNIKF